MLRKIIKYLFVIIITIFFMFAGFFAGLAISQFLQSNKYSLLSIITATFYVAISVIIALYLQNGGKFVVGKVLGYKLVSGKLTDFLMVPLNEHVSLKTQLIYHSGGIIADILGSLVCIIILIADPLKFDNLYRLLIMSVAAGLILTACINFTSYFSSEKPNDGKIIWNIISGNSLAKEYLLDIKLTTLLTDGIRPSKIPIDKPNKENCSPYDMKLALHLYYKALDANKTKYVLNFSRFLEENISAASNEILTDIKKELCFMNCLMGKTTEASIYYSDIKDILENSYDISFLRVRSYYELYINQNKDNAVFFAKAALSFKDQFKLKGYIPMEERLLKDIIL